MKLVAEAPAQVPGRWACQGDCSSGTFSLQQQTSSRTRLQERKISNIEKKKENLSNPCPEPETTCSSEGSRATCPHYTISYFKPFSRQSSPENSFCLGRMVAGLELDRN